MPALWVKNSSGTWSSVIQPWVKNSSGSWAPVLNVWVKTGGTWQLSWTGFTAQAVPSSLEKFDFGPTITTDTAVASQTGGVGPFAYQWTYVSGSPAISVLTSTSDTTAFRATGMASLERREAVFKCVVTDTTTGVTADSNPVSVAIERT